VAQEKRGKRREEAQATREAITVEMAMKTSKEKRVNQGVIAVWKNFGKKGGETLLRRGILGFNFEKKGF